MRVLLVSPLPPPVGGIATWTQAVVAKSAEVSCDVSVVNTAVRWRSITKSSPFARVFIGAFEAIGLVRSVFVNVRKIRPNLVHVSTGADLGLLRDLVFLIIAKSFGSATVLHIHREIPREGVLHFLVHLLRRFSDKIVLLAEQSKVNLAISGDDVVVVPNMLAVDGIPSQELLKGFQREPVVLFVGHVRREKGAVDLAVAFSDRFSDNDRFTLRYIGPVEESVRLEILDVVGLSGRSRVEFLGAKGRDEVLAQMRRAVVLCLPSYSEGFPYVLLEAMSAGCPVIATRVGAIPEMIGDSCGIIISPGDQVGLAASIQRLVDNPDDWYDFQCNALQRVKTRFSSSVVMSKLRETWLAAIGASLLNNK